MSQFYIPPQSQISLKGSIHVPGDKSISHRSIILGSLAEGKTTISGFLQGADSIVTMNAFRRMGVVIEQQDNADISIQGVGLNGLQKPAKVLNMGNSGTSMRLLSGILSGQNFDTTLSGDASLNSRPMRRIAAPLALMGGEVLTSEGGTAPLTIKGNKSLTGIEYLLPMASAQVKSAILLAGLYAQGETAVMEPEPTRDHTERMLHSFNYPVTIDKESRRSSLHSGNRLQACRIQVPGDISSAAFFLVAASIAEDSDITLHNVGMNPTRIGVINILGAMGADIEAEYITDTSNQSEPIANLRVRSSSLNGIRIPVDQVPLAIDEFPAIFIAAACAKGKTLLTNAEELRHKESDRIAAMATGLEILGINVTATDDGIIIEGNNTSTDKAVFKGGEINSYHDHRIAMAFAIAGLHSKAAITITDCDNVKTSFPNFIECCAQLGLDIQVR